MSIWHIVVTKGKRSLMEEIRDALSVLLDVGHKIGAVSAAVDAVTEAHERLSATQAQFRPAMELAEKLMAANPTCEAVVCGGTAHVLVRLPSGGVTVLPLTHWSELEMPAPETSSADYGESVASGMAAAFRAQFDDPDSPREDE